MKLINISKNYNNLQVLEDINLQFPEGKISVILGNSGCGKTTLLNIISGKVKEFSGTIQYERESSLPKFSYVFQNDILIPWKNVYSNLKFICKKWYSPNQLEEIINRNLKIVKLENYKNYFPIQLSGGMKKRVGIARAFSFPSEIMLLDEPFSGLDINITKSITDDFLALQKEIPKTIILVTHDLDIAIKLGDFFFILSDKPTTLKERVERRSFPNLENLKTHILELL